MNAKLCLLAIIASAAVGFYFGSRDKLRHTLNEPQTNEWRLKYEQLHKKFAQISEVDINEYLKLKEERDRYKKADEILAKILQIMLVDLGIRSSGPQIESVKHWADNESAAKSPNNSADNKNISTSLPARKAFLSPGTNPNPAGLPTVDMNKVREVTNESQAKEFLKNAEIADFFAALKGASAIDANRLEMLNGNYVGEAIFDEPNRAPWQVSIRLNGRVTENGSVRGRHSIRLARNGRQFSHSSGQIGNDRILSLGHDSAGAVIELGGDNGYFHLFYFPRMDGFYGNVYEKAGVGVYKRAGIVNLVRQR